MAEEKIEEILSTIRPSPISETRRKEVVDCIKKLLKASLGVEVFAFGSGPLQTYLPDGDIDLTVLSPAHTDEELSKNVLDVLKCEESGSFLWVRDVQYIPAKVPIVKCIIDNIPIDISFNQASGLHALGFKEKVSLFVGKNQLFRNSVLLVKAWGYYESRIIGAKHGFLSAYAIDTLVIYILNVFHKSLWSPLAVLYRFLEYYSSFDWDNYCISINGPVPISSLPAVVAISESRGDRLLLDPTFLKNCREASAAQLKALDMCLDFQVKHLNIIDPLKHNNNLGRSVSKGNSHQIRRAFSIGARKFGEILSLRGQFIRVELDHFFVLTLHRNGMGQASTSSFNCTHLSSPSSSSFQNRSVGNARFHWFPGFYQGDGQLYIPSAIHVDERRRSRGFVPDVVHRCGTGPRLSNHGLPPPSSFPRHGCPPPRFSTRDFSSQNFLPGRFSGNTTPNGDYAPPKTTANRQKPLVPENNQPGQPHAQSRQAKDIPLNIEFGTLDLGCSHLHQPCCRSKKNLQKASKKKGLQDILINP